MTNRCQIAIVGAGPYGLSLAAQLGARGADFQIFGEPMSFWQANMPKGMHLKSDGFASNLYDPAGAFTLGSFCAETGIPYHDTRFPVSLDTFVRYGLAFQERFAPQLRRQNVTKVSKLPDGFSLELENEETVKARQVVIGVGVREFKHIPSPLDTLPSEFVSHSCQHSDLQNFANRDVAVIGAGASATDLAALLHESGANVNLICRDQVIRFNSEGTVEARSLWRKLRHPKSGIGPGLRTRFYCDAPWAFHHFPERLRLLIVSRTLGPASAAHIKERVVGRVSLLPAHILERADVRQGRVHLTLRDANGSTRNLVIEHVIAATGYRVDVKRLTFLSPEIQSHLAAVDGTPVLSAAMESSVPGLYFIGPATANSFGPVMRFAFGAGFAAPHMAKMLVRSPLFARQPRASGSLASSHATG